MDQVLSQVETFCKVYSNLDFLLSFDSSNFLSSLAKYIGQSECLVTVCLEDDRFQWDLLANNNPEEFALIYARDQKLNATDFVDVEQTLRLQIQTYLYHKYLHISRFIGNLTQKPLQPNYVHQLEGSLN